MSPVGHSKSAEARTQGMKNLGTLLFAITPADDFLQIQAKKRTYQIPVSQW
jgi:hypothetical protein